MNMVEEFKKHWLVTGLAIIAICVGATWKICLETRVEPKTDIIKLKDEKIAELEKKVRILESELKTLKEKQNSKKTTIQHSIENLEGKIKRIEQTLMDFSNIKAKKLEILNIYYQSPGSNEKLKISTNQTVEAEGQIWFEIKLTELGGYLLAFLRDSSGKMFNLFPGTKQAVIDGYYRVPYHLNNPRTDVQRTAADNTMNMNLPLERILIGGYIFDDAKGDEIFHFYYLDKREKGLEQIIKDALETGKDITLMKGVLRKVTRFYPINFDRTIDRPIFYRNELKLRFKHK